MVVAVLAAAAPALARSPTLGRHGARAVAPKLLAHDTSTPFARRTAGTRALAAVTLSSFDGISQPGPYAPADANGDIGRTQYVQAVNLYLSVFSRAAGNTLLAQLPSNAFWNGLGGPIAAGLCASSPGGDPSLVYDDRADRWVMSEFAFDVDSTGSPTAPFVECIAVSTTADATGTWNRYAFQVSTTKFPDYPKLAVWQDGYYLSFNQFDSTGAWSGAGALAVERSQMLTGGAAQARYFDLGSVSPGLGGMLPASQDGSLAPTGGDEIYSQVDDDPANVNDRLELWRFHADWTGPAANSRFTPIANLSVPSFSAGFLCAQPGSTALWSSCIAQPSVTTTLDPVAEAMPGVPQLMYRLQYLKTGAGVERLVVSHTVDVGANQAGIRWYEVRYSGGGGSGSESWTSTGTFSLEQVGTYAPNAESRFMGSAAVNGSGELALGYSVAGPATFPSLRYTGQVAGDLANSMGATVGEPSLAAGSAAQTASSRWGDYSSLSVDPIDECTFWFTGEYYTGTTWKTRIGSFQLTSCALQLFPLLTADPTWSGGLVREGQTLTATAGTWTGSSGTTYQWRRCDRYGLACTDISGETAATHTLSAADAAGDRTIRVQVTAAGAFGSAAAASTATPIVQSLPPTNVVRPLISGTAVEGQTLTTTAGTWTSSSPVSYTYRWRRCSSGTCVNIAGAAGASYVAAAADIGSTVDAIVSATNTGGGVDAIAVATAAVTAAPAGSGGAGASGGGSSGGGGGAADLGVAVSASAASAQLGDSLTFRIPVTDVNGALAFGVRVDVTLPSNLTLAFAKTDRGSGCTQPAPRTLACDLDFLSGVAPVGTVTVVGTVNGSGSLVLGASVPAVAGETVTANNSASITVAGPAAVPVPPPPFVDRKSPKVQALGSGGRLRGVVKLRFRIADDSANAKAVVRVLRGRKVLATLSSGFGKVVPGQVYYVPWAARAAASSFCVVGTDRAGHTSAPACARLSLRP